MTRNVTAYNLSLPHIRELEGYVPGMQPQDDRWVKLNTNENPYPPSPHVAAAIRSELDKLPLYPNPESTPLREVIAAKHGLNVDQIIVGNGSDDILNLVVRAFCGKDQPAASTIPNYTLYPVLTRIQNGEFKTIPYDREMNLPLDAIVGSETSLFFLSSPNTPTGVVHPVKDIADLLDRYPGILVVDEAYADFAKETALELVKHYPNVIITRSLSKAYSLAGLRVGYGLAAAEVINLMDRVRDSYNVNRLSQAGAIAALEDASYHKKVISNIVKLRDSYIREFKNRNWFTYPSQANFIFTEPVSSGGIKSPEVAQSLFDFLYARNILVRFLSSSPLTAGFLRISIGDDAQMRTLLENINLWQKNV